MNETQNQRNEREDGSSSVRTLTVRVASPEAAFDELEERFAALDAGDEPEPLYEVVLQREEDLTRLLRPGTIELLRTVAREHPESIRETARLVGRDVHQVHDTVTELARLNLLRLEEEGRRKRPVVWYDDLEIELSIGNGHEPAVSV
jgi:predicted transcriptional regulator